jgi:hypothetical protein
VRRDERSSKRPSDSSAASQAACTTSEAAEASSRRPAPPSTCATPVSRRSTEGTTGIQASDLVGRKLAGDEGRAARAVARAIRETLAALAGAAGDDLAALRRALGQGSKRSRPAPSGSSPTTWAAPARSNAGAVPFLEVAGTVCGGWQLARSALIASRHLADGHPDAGFYRPKLATARFYADHILPRATALADAVQSGAPGVLALEEDRF